jgi:hypothetical protein
MILKLGYKTKKISNMILKIIFTMAGFYFLLNNIQTKTINQVLFSNILNNQTFILIILLSGLNWLFEIKKWQYINTISFKRAAKESLIGHAIGSLTPLKLGDYYIKAKLHKQSNKTTILKNNLKSNIHQLACTLFFGIVGCLYLLKLKKLINNIHIIVVLMLLITTIIFYSKIKSHFNKLLAYSAVRYILFSSQFIILILLVSDKFSFEIIAITYSMYLLSSLVPVISIFDISIKGSVAVYLFSIFTNIPSSSIICVSFVGWLLNFIIPSLVGLIIFLTFKIERR